MAKDLTSEVIPKLRDYEHDLRHTPITHDYYRNFRNSEHIKFLTQDKFVGDLDDANVEQIILKYQQDGIIPSNYWLFRLQKTYIVRATLVEIERLIRLTQDVDTTLDTYLDLISKIIDGLGRQIRFRDWESKDLLRRYDQHMIERYPVDVGHLNYRNQLVRILNWFLRAYDDIKYENSGRDFSPPLTISDSFRRNLYRLAIRTGKFLQQSRHYYLVF